MLNSHRLWFKSVNRSCKKSSSGLESSAGANAEEMEDCPYCGVSSKPGLAKILLVNQISANNSTKYCYSKITWKLGTIRGLILRQIGVVTRLKFYSSYGSKLLWKSINGPYRFEQLLVKKLSSLYKEDTFLTEMRIRSDRETMLTHTLEADMH